MSKPVILKNGVCGAGTGILQAMCISELAWQEPRSGCGSSGLIALRRGCTSSCLAPACEAVGSFYSST